MKLKEASELLVKLRDGHKIPVEKHEDSIKFLEDMELVDVYGSRVILTQKGNLAAGMGLKSYLKYNRTEKEILNFSISKTRKKSQFLLLAFVILFILFITFLVLNF